MSSSLSKILNPRSIAVAGASPDGRGGGFVAPLVSMGFKGKIYPVNPKYPEVMGFTCYPTVRDIPESVDYVISSVPSGAALDLMKDCVEKKVKCVHYFTARFSETGRPEDAALEREILRTAKAGGVRIIGPNCMGLYNPAAGISMNNGMSTKPGNVGMASQSGGVLGQIIGNATQRGLGFTQAISYGNAIDLNECDYLEHFTADSKTRVILMYIEGIKDGRRFVSALKNATAVKPVVILKGGRSDAGTRATASHTASLAGFYNIFQGVVKGAGGVLVRDFDEMVDLAVAFNYLPADVGRRLGVMGGTGGSSVNAADLLSEAGLNVVPIPQDIRDTLQKEGIGGHDWFNNPIDGSISMGDNRGPSRLMELMAAHDNFDTLIAQPPGPRWGRQRQGLEDVMKYSLHRRTKKPVVMLQGGGPRNPDENERSKLASQIRETLFNEGVATFPTMTRAANALGKVTEFYEYRRQWADA